MSAFIILFLTIILFSELIFLVDSFIQNPLLSGLIAHLCMILILHFIAAKKKLPFSRVDFFKKVDAIYYFPAGVYFFLILSIWLMISLRGMNIELTNSLILMVFLIPIGEEIVYRHFLTQYLQREFPSFLASYVSICSFSIMHSLPTLSRVLEGHFAIVLGPFLLGVLNEILSRKANSIKPAIALHMAANLSGPVFLKLDSNFFEKISIFYQN